MSGLLPQYIHIVKPRLRHTYLSFDEAGNLLIKSPKVSQHYLEQLLLKKAKWIRQTQERILKKKGRKPDFGKDCVLCFLGEEIGLTLVPYEKKRTRLVLDPDGFRIFYSQYDEAVFHRQIDTFYKKEAEKVLPQIVAQHAEQMGLSPSAVRFRKTKRQWGSCSAKNVISLNTMLMKLPVRLIDYVVIHELAHIEHKHHQKSFWKLVGQHMPDYKARIKELHSYTT